MRAWCHAQAHDCTKGWLGVRTPTADPTSSKSLCEVLACMRVTALTCCLPDWVEHALETDTEPYLRTPEEELSFIVRHNTDVNACIAGASLGLLYVLWQTGRLAGSCLLNRSSKVKDA